MRKKLRGISLKLVAVLLAALLTFPAVSASKEKIKNNNESFFRECYSKVSDLVKSHKKASIVTVAVIGSLDIICLIPAASAAIVWHKVDKDDLRGSYRHSFCWMFFHPVSSWKDFWKVKGSFLTDSQQLVSDLSSL